MYTIVAVILIVAAVGVLCWFISTVPLPPMIKNVLWAVLALVLIIAIWNYTVGGSHLSLGH
jgi:hypothetical protein